MSDPKLLGATTVVVHRRRRCAFRWLTPILGRRRFRIRIVPTPTFATTIDNVNHCAAQVSLVGQYNTDVYRGASTNTRTEEANTLRQQVVSWRSVTTTSNDCESAANCRS